MRALSVLLGRGLLVLSLSSVAGLVGCGDDDDTVITHPDGGAGKGGSSSAGKGGSSSTAGKGGSSSAGKGGTTSPAGDDGGVDAGAPEADAG